MAFLDLLFPKTCLNCRNPGSYLCPDCLKEIRLIKQQICPVCGRFSFFGETHRFCQKKRSLDGLTSFFDYQGVIKKAIHQLKFKLVTDLTDELFVLAVKVLEENDKNQFSKIKGFVKSKKPLIVPVPMHWYKENLRGFNQAEILAEKFAEYWGLEYEKILIRSGFTQPQSGLNREERKRNVNNVFCLKDNLLPSNILIVDDIWTTGATLKTSGIFLKKSGAKMVWGLTFCR